MAAAPIVRLTARRSKNQNGYFFLDMARSIEHNANLDFEGSGYMAMENAKLAQQKLIAASNACHEGAQLEIRGGGIGMKKFAYVVYKVTFPNGKIYIGKDIGYDGHTIRYFGSWDHRRVEEDFTKVELSDFSIRREILFESQDKQEVGRMEMSLIVQLGSNDPAKGYNRTPKFRQ